MPAKLPIWDIRMIELMDYVVFNKLKKVDTTEKFRAIIGINNSTTINQVKKGKQSFTHTQLHKAAKHFNISMDWFYGFTDTMYRINSKLTATGMIKEGLRILESK